MTNFTLSFLLLAIDLKLILGKLFLLDEDYFTKKQGKAMINKKNIMLTLIFLSFNNTPTLSMEEVFSKNEEHVSSTKKIKSSLNFDEKRQMFYVGSPLSEIRKLRQSDSTPDLMDSYKIVFNTNEEQSEKQNLLRGSSWANEVLHDYDLLEKNHGIPSKSIDRRIRPPSYHDHPWNTHGKLLSIFYGGGKAYMSLGSGTLVGERTVLTAAHNLYDYDEKLAASLVYFYPGRNGQHSICKGTSIQVMIHPEYFYNEKSDIGAVILDPTFKDEAITNGIQFLKVKGFEKVELLGQDVRITGYPGGVVRDGNIEFLDGNHMYTMTGQVKDIHEDIGRIFYDIDTSAGQSGSAITTNDDHCCGVHIRGGNIVSGNIGTFLNKDLILFVDHWLDWLK